jgi:hypothetical protein
MDNRLTVTKGDWTPEAMDALKERLLKVEGSVEYGADPGGTVTCWHRNPDGPEALARIEALEQHVSELEEALSDVRRRLEYGLQSAGLGIHVSASLGVIDAALAKARNEQVKQ